MCIGIRNSLSSALSNAFRSFSSTPIYVDILCLSPSAKQLHPPAYIQVISTDLLEAKKNLWLNDIFNFDYSKKVLSHSLKLSGLMFLSSSHCCAVAPGPWNLAGAFTGF